MGGKVLNYRAKELFNQGGETQRRNSVVKMLDLGRTPEAISEFTGEDLNYIRRVQKETLVATK